MSVIPMTGRPFKDEIFVMAVEAVARLRKEGFRAVRLDLGVLDSQAQGFRIETTAMAGGKSNMEGPSTKSSATRTS